MEVESFAETVTSLLGTKEMPGPRFKTSDLNAFSFKGEAQASSSGDHGTEDASKKPGTRSSMQTKISDLFDPASSKLAFDIIKKGVLPSSFFGDTKDKPKKQPDEKAKPSSPTETVEIKPKTSDSDSTKAEDIEMKPTEDKPELEPTEFQPKTDPQDSVASGLFGGVEDEGPTFDTDMVEPDMESLEAVESLLCVAPPWCNLIVTKQKTWELRSYQTKVRNLVYD
jgi:hypothetical protein